MSLLNCLCVLLFQLTTYTVDMLVLSKLFVDASKKAGVKHMVVRHTRKTHNTHTSRRTELTVFSLSAGTRCSADPHVMCALSVASGSGVPGRSASPRCHLASHDRTIHRSSRVRYMDAFAPNVLHGGRTHTKSQQQNHHGSLVSLTNRIAVIQTSQLLTLSLLPVLPFWWQNLIAYGGVDTINGHNLVVPYHPDVKLTWVCCDDIGACAATVLANPSAHASKVYPLVVDAASHAEIAEVLSKMMGQPFNVHKVDIKDWYKCLIEHGCIEVSQRYTLDTSIAVWRWTLIKQ